MALYSKPVIFAVISILVLALIYDSTFIPNVSSKITRSGEKCNPVGDGRQFCCGTERDDKGTKSPIDDTYKTYCEVCTDYGPDLRICDDYEGQQPPEPSGPAVLPDDGVLEQPPTPPPNGPAAPLQDGGVLEEPATPLGPTPPTQGQGVLPEGGVLEQPSTDEGTGSTTQRTIEEPSATEGTQPAVAEEDPVPSCAEGQVFDEESGLCVLEDCPEDQVLDEETGLCVLEEQETDEEPQSDEEEQTSDQEDSSENNSNN